MEGGMKPDKIGKFGTFIRFIGYLIVIPSILGVLFAVLLFFAGGSATSTAMNTATSEAEKAGAAIGSMIGFGFSMVVFCSSLVGGLIGWILLIKKKVFRCIRCGFILDRA